MYCTNCGAKVPKNAKVCGNCGQPLKPIDQREKVVEQAVQSPPPKRSAAATIKRTKEAKQIPGWIWGALALLIAASAAVWFFVIVPSQSPTASNFASDSGSNTNPITTSPPEPQNDNYYVHLGALWAESDQSIVAPSETPIVMFIGWVTKTREYAQQFLDSIHLEVTFNGEQISNPMQYWTPIEQVSGDYSVQWQYPLGILSPGTYVVQVDFTYDFQFTDGFDSNGDGSEDEFGGEYWEDHYSRTLIIE